jgi:hypothetical protein
MASLDAGIAAPARKLETFGDYPPALYRAFDRREYAEAFVNGIVRFGLVTYYGEIEDKRRSDRAEGSGSIVAPGIVTKVTMNRDGQVTKQWEEPGHVHHSVTFGNGIYILSLSHPTNDDLSVLQEKFGSHVVQIDEPRVFGQDLTDALANGAADTAGVIECVRVLYNKGAIVTTSLDRDARLRLSYGQKPAEFAAEQEYRLVLISQRPASKAERYLEVNLAKPLPYARIVA